MILLTGYKSKKELKAAIGQPLQYQETSVFGAEYRASGVLFAAHRPQISRLPGREFFAKITMQDEVIKKVE